MENRFQQDRKRKNTRRCGLVGGTVAVLCIAAGLLRFFLQPGGRRGAVK